MMNDIPEIKDIDSTMLAQPVRQTLDSASAEISDWEHHPISYINTEEASLGLHRFKGIARDRGEERAWSIVLKAVKAPPNEMNPAHWNYHRREVLAYEEGLLTVLPGGLSAPRCLGITKYAGGVCWLWLEDVLDPESLPWSLTDYGAVARNLGQFNGAYLTGRPLPNRPWLSRNWIRGWLDHYEAEDRQILDLIREEQFWKIPPLDSAFPRPITDDVLRLWDRYDSLLATLAQLPQTFCHLDAYRPNLFLRWAPDGSSQTVAVDWVFTGIGAVGEEIANLLAASLIWLEHDAADAWRLDQAVFNGYLDGLRDAGWRDDPRIARLGFTAACALRWGLVGLWWMLTLDDVGERAELEAHWNRPLPELASQWAKTEIYLLGLAEEAYELQKQLL
jgi:hypothetical protein